MRGHQSWPSSPLGALLAVMWLAVVPAAAQSPIEMTDRALETRDIQVDDQITNAIKAAEDAAKAYATSGKSQGGATGTIASLLTNSDTIICDSWQIAFGLAMRQLSTEGAVMTDEGAALVQRLNQLRSLIEAACQKALGPRRVNTTGGAGVTSGPSGTVPACPECEPARLAYEAAKARHDRAEFDYERARAQTQWVLEMWLQNPRNAGQVVVTTPAEAERIEDRRHQEWETARAEMERLHKAYLACLEACNTRTREETRVGFFGGRTPYYLAGGLGGVLAAVAVAGGGEPPPAFSANVTGPVATPSPGTTTNQPPAAAPEPERPSPAGQMRCSACRPLADPDRHELVLRFCQQLIALFDITLNSPMRISHPAPFPSLSGDYNESTLTFTGSTMATIGSFSGVAARVEVRFQQSGTAINTAEMVVTLGENGVFPGGRLVSYLVNLSR